MAHFRRNIFLWKVIFGCLVHSHESSSAAKATHTKRKIYFCLLFFTGFLIFFLSSTSNREWLAMIPRPPPTLSSSGLASVEKGFLVFSKNCRIRDVDPFDPTVRHLVAWTKPLDCSEYRALTITDGDILRINTTMAEISISFNFSCCYRSIFRASDGFSDDETGMGKHCTYFENETTVKDEFIVVLCSQNGTVFYRNFHSFIHDKPEVEKRCEANQNHNNPHPQYSVLVVGVDSMSRLNMHRQLNRTARYLLEHMNAVEMFGFNKVGDNTFPNLIPLLMGYDERELPLVCWKSHHEPLDKCDFLWNRFARKGYRTFYAEDTPFISSFNYQKLGFFHQPTDYYFRNFIIPYERILGRSLFMSCHLCVGSISETEAVLQWTQKFVSNFQDRPFFAFAWINSLTHDFLNLGSAGDYMYEEFFKSLYTSGSLHNTVVIFIGDHGMRWGAIRSTYIGSLEERLPMLLVAFPKDFQVKFPALTKFLQYNSHRLITPFDLYATLENILNFEGTWREVDTENVNEDLVANFSNRALSLLGAIPENRSCKDASIDEHWCTCQMSTSINPKFKEVRLVAKYIVNQLNLIVMKNKVCAFLTLWNVTDSCKWVSPTTEESESPIYTVVIRTKPGGGIFEGTVKYGSTYELLGTISRLNLYGKQSACVQDAILKKYCYCLRHLS